MSIHGLVTFQLRYRNVLYLEANPEGKAEAPAGSGFIPMWIDFVLDSYLGYLSDQSLQKQSFTLRASL